MRIGTCYLISGGNAVHRRALHLTGLQLRIAGDFLQRAGDIIGQITTEWSGRELRLPVLALDRYRGGAVAHAIALRHRELQPQIRVQEGLPLDHTLFRIIPIQQTVDGREMLRPVAQTARCIGLRDLLRAHPALMKRPLIDAGGALYLGWAKDTQAALL